MPITHAQTYCTTKIKTCKKVKDPCKICLQTVKRSNGIQCQGACEAWVHYECLNYTPGKIQDIKKGIIRVICPCPDCKTGVPKELRVNEPYNCNNVECTANNPPTCEKEFCQAVQVNNEKGPPCPPPGSLAECGTDCRNFGQPGVFASPPLDPCMKGYPVYGDADGPLPVMHMRAPITNMMPTLDAVEQMCATVGQLTEQINMMLVRMKDVATSEQCGPGKREPQGGPKHAKGIQGTAGACGKACGGKTTVVGVGMHGGGGMGGGGMSGGSMGGGSMGRGFNHMYDGSGGGALEDNIKEECPTGSLRAGDFDHDGHQSEPYYKPCYCPGNPERSHYS